MAAGKKAQNTHSEVEEQRHAKWQINKTHINLYMHEKQYRKLISNIDGPDYDNTYRIGGTHTHTHGSLFPRYNFVSQKYNLFHTHTGIYCICCFIIHIWIWCHNGKLRSVSIHVIFGPTIWRVEYRTVVDVMTWFWLLGLLESEWRLQLFFFSLMPTHKCTMYIHTSIRIRIHQKIRWQRHHPLDKT